RKSNYHFNLGETYYKLERWNQAEAAIMEALRFSSDSNRPIYQKKLGAALNQLGNTYSSKGEDLQAQNHKDLHGQTIEALEKAIKLDPKDAVHKNKLLQLKRKKVIEEKFGLDHSKIRTGVLPITIEYDKSLDPWVMDPGRQALHPDLVAKLG